MTQPQQPSFEDGPNMPPQPYGSNATAPAPSKKFGLGTVIATAAVSALAGAATLVAVAYATDSAERLPAEQYAYGTQNWLLEKAATKLLVNNGTMRESADIACTIIEDNPGLNLPDQRTTAEDAIMEAFPGMDPEKVTAIFLSATATGCPHLVDSVAVTGLQMTLHGME